MPAPRRFYGKYRGVVERNVDPLFTGRVEVSCPAVFGEGRHNWAMPSSPYAGRGVGLFAVPPEGAHVWVEFEGGDPSKPIVGGCFWLAGEVPADPGAPHQKVFKTDALTVSVDDLPGVAAVTVQIAGALPVKIAADAQGLKISVGRATIALSAASVSINDGALEVMNA